MLGFCVGAGYPSDALVLESKTSQTLFPNCRETQYTKDDSSLASKFSCLMFNGKVKDALRLLSSESQGNVLHLNSDVLSSLINKHPKKQPPDLTALIDSPPGDLSHPIMFDQMDAIRVCRIALKLHEAAGPSGLDASAWKRMCTSFQVVSDDLCEALSTVSRRLCTEFVDPEGLSSFVICHLIALDKNPGVRPIGVGETVRHLIAKVVLSVIHDDIQAAAGPLQLCAGQLCGCEAAVHSMRKLWSSSDVEGVILVDA